MADRTTARNFGKIFEELYRWPQSSQRKEMAQRLYDSTQDFDFDTDQMQVPLNILFNLDIELRDNDSLLYQKNSPFRGQKPYKGIGYNGSRHQSFCLVRLDQEFEYEGRPYQRTELIGYRNAQGVKTEEFPVNEMHIHFEDTDLVEVSLIKKGV